MRSSHLTRVTGLLAAISLAGVACSGGGGGPSNTGNGTGNPPPPPPTPPSNLTYSTNPAVYTKGIAIAWNTPSSSGGAVASYSMAPPLPAGLSYASSYGVIIGTPTAVSAATDYTVTATNAA